MSPSFGVSRDTLAQARVREGGGGMVSVSLPCRRDLTSSDAAAPAKRSRPHKNSSTLYCGAVSESCGTELVVDLAIVRTHY